MVQAGGQLGMGGLFFWGWVWWVCWVVFFVGLGWGGEGGTGVGVCVGVVDLAVGEVTEGGACVLESDGVGGVGSGEGVARRHAFRHEPLPLLASRHRFLVLELRLCAPHEWCLKRPILGIQDLDRQIDRIHVRIRFGGDLRTVRREREREREMMFEFPVMELFTSW